MSDFRDVINKQRLFFNDQQTKDLNKRASILKQLKKIISDNEPVILDALSADLGRNTITSYMSEIYLVKKEIDFALINLKKWIKPTKVSSPLLTFPSKSSIIFEPYGVSLIISPWNYPFLLSLSPLISSIAAGNTVILKPSEQSSRTACILEKIINSEFNPEYIKIIIGGTTTAKKLLKLKYDYVFYTGNETVAKTIMKQLAENLTPSTLELGGKSPCIVDNNVDIDITAKRIVWGKFINAGQTCVAPDYLLVNSAIKDDLINKIIHYIKVFFTEEAIGSNDYAKIINEKHFKRITHLIQGNILYGGNHSIDKLFIEPTIIDVKNWQHPAMDEEIFGPLLPVIAYKEEEEIISRLINKPKPLALYIFSTSNSFVNKIHTSLPSGTLCINDTIKQLVNLNLPFGGVGDSGIGNYHGYHGFKTFSHKKSIMKRNFLFDTKIIYPPYKYSLDIIKKLF